MTPVILRAIGPVTRYSDPPSFEARPGKRILARGNQCFTLSRLDEWTDEAECHDCHRKIAFAHDTPWVEIDDAMRIHREKFCPAKIEQLRRVAGG